MCLSPLHSKAHKAQHILYFFLSSLRAYGMHNPPLARSPLSSPSSLNVPFTSSSHGSLHPPQGGCPSTALSSDGWFFFFFFLLQFLYHCQEVGRWYPSCSLLLLPKHSSSLLSKTCNFESYLLRLFHPLLFKIEVQLIYNVVLSFRCTESDSVTYMYIYIFFSYSSPSLVIKNIEYSSLCYIIH